MKILTGELRGRPILFKPNPHLRPTSDKTRKAIFDMLQGRLEGARALDLFSGTGALGFEALSNGAARVIFVESDKRQARSIEENLGALGLREKGEVIVADALRAVERFSCEGGIFDLVWMDPPYEREQGLACLEALAASTVVKKEGLVVVEAEATACFPENVGNFKRIKEKKYGDTKILIYKVVGVSYC